MPATDLKSFLRELTDSEILTADQARDFCKQRGFTAATPARDVAQAMIENKHVTLFQADAALKGQARMLNIGAYRVLDRIGAGGMGTVYRATHRFMNRTVALKMMNQSQMAGSGSTASTMRARFFREVEAAAKLAHPNIVTAYDAGDHAGTPFLAMEYVEGRDLQEIIKKHGPLPSHQAIDFIKQAAQGIRYAHDNGIVHRDIKPSNMLLTPGGKVKLMDMGLARFNQPQPGSASDVEVTTTGVMLGTAAYMPPEQAVNPRDADHRADIYALGCSLFYLMTARIPYPGSTAMQVLLAKREDPVPQLVDFTADVPDGLQSVFEGMLAARPDERYQQVAEVIEDLDNVTAGIAVAPRAAAPPASEFDQRLASLEDTVVDEGPVDLSAAVRAEPQAPPKPLPKARKTKTPSLGLMKVAAIAIAAIAAVAVIGYLLSRAETEAEPDPDVIATVSPQKPAPRPDARTTTIEPAALSSLTLRDVVNMFETPPVNAWFAAPDVGSTGDGSEDRPFNLADALAGKHAIAPGDFLWLREGTYAAPDRAFRINLAATPDKPIHIRTAIGEHTATLVSPIILEANSNAVWLHDLELAPANAGPAVEVRGGASHRFTSLHVHTALGGVIMTDDAQSALVYGCTFHDIRQRPAVRMLNTDNFGGIVNTLIARAGDRPVVAALPLFEGNVIFQSQGRAELTPGAGGELRAAHNVLHGTSLNLSGSADAHLHAESNIIVDARLTAHRQRDNFILPPGETRPQGVNVMTRRTTIGPPRIHVTILNWQKLDQVAVNPSDDLRAGVGYDVFDPLAAGSRAIATGYYDGNPITLPTSGEFNTFIIQPIAPRRADRNEAQPPQPPADTDDRPRFAPPTDDDGDTARRPLRPRDRDDRRLPPPRRR